MLLASKDSPKHGDCWENDFDRLQSANVGCGLGREARFDITFGNHCRCVVGRVRITDRDVGEGCEFGNQVLWRGVAGNRDLGTIEGGLFKAGNNVSRGVFEEGSDGFQLMLDVEPINQGICICDDQGAVARRGTYGICGIFIGREKQNV